MSEKKMFRINQYGDEELTFEEICTKYRNLILSQIQHWNGTIDATDVESAGYLGLYKAYGSYDFKKSATAFGYYAKSIINNEILMFYRKEKKWQEKTISINEPICIDDDGNELTFADTLISTQNIADLYEEKISFFDDLELVKELISKLPERHQKVIYGVISGKTQRQASAIAGYAPSYGSRIISKLYRNFLKEKKKGR
jgi:RNA polymerase sporulation-specific sigma factor